MCCSFTSLGGPRPHAHPAGVRQIVTCDNNVLDRQIVAWAVARGHRQKNYKCDVLSCSKNFLKMRSSNYVNLTNGGKNGITIRLQRLLCKRLVKRRLQSCRQFCMDHDGSWYPKGYSKKSERNFFQNEVPKQNWVSNFQPNSSRICSEVSGQIHWLQNQCWGGEKVPVYSTMDQSFGERSGRSISSNAAEIVSTSNPGRAPAWVFLCIYKYKRIKEQAQAH